MLNVYLESGRCGCVLRTILRGLLRRYGLEKLLAISLYCCSGYRLVQSLC